MEILPTWAADLISGYTQSHIRRVYVMMPKPDRLLQRGAIAPAIFLDEPPIAFHALPGEYAMHMELATYSLSNLP